MNYEAWRISYQSSEQAAIAAFKAWQAAKEQQLIDEVTDDMVYAYNPDQTPSEARVARAIINAALRSIKTQPQDQPQ